MIDTLIGVLKIVSSIVGTFLVFYLIAKLGAWYEDKQKRK
tara:strand:- start:209 stop:328 length:120 start_codon:yes stop_codon:yes gene_type:complete